TRRRPNLSVVSSSTVRNHGKLSARVPSKSKMASEYAGMEAPCPPPPNPSTIVDFAAHQFQPAPRDAVGPAVARGDGVAPLQLLEQQHADIGQHKAVAVDAGDLIDAAAIVLERLDDAALRKHVQHAL